MEAFFKGGRAKVLCNPALSKERVRQIESMLWSYSLDAPHLWIASSGSFLKEGVSKWVALSQKALFASAASVNEHLMATKKDVWLNPLPLFHVGGLGILLRASLLGCKVVDYGAEGGKWSPEKYYQTLTASAATLTALVPAQLYDLIVRQYPAPRSLRAVLIGGGALGEALYRKARDLGWPALPTYGMTEACSQVATAPLSSLESKEYPQLSILHHLALEINSSGLLTLAGTSLLTLYGMIEGDSVGFKDPKVNGVFVTSDRGQVKGRCLTLFGRSDDVVKVLGENVDLAALQALIDSLKLEKGIEGDYYVLAREDERKGNKLILVISLDCIDAAGRLLSYFNASVFPYERIDEIVPVQDIPKTSLGKLERRKLADRLQEIPFRG